MALYFLLLKSIYFIIIHFCLFAQAWGAAAKLLEHLSNVVCDLLNLALGLNLQRHFFLFEFVATVNVPKRMVIYACRPFHLHLCSKFLPSEGKRVRVPLTQTLKIHL